MKIAIIILFLIPSITFSQDSLFHGIFPMKGDKVSYEIVMTVDSTSKNILFSRAKNWAISQYNSQKDALQVDDREAGILAYKGYFTNVFEWPARMGILGNFQNSFQGLQDKDFHNRFQNKRYTC